MSERDSERRDRIADRAYEIYQARGGEHGLAEDDWLQAEREIAAESNPAPADAGPNVPIATGGVGEHAGEVMPDVDEPGEEKMPLPPPGQAE